MDDLGISLFLETPKYLQLFYTFVTYTTSPVTTKRCTWKDLSWSSTTWSCDGAITTSVLHKGYMHNITYKHVIIYIKICYYVWIVSSGTLMWLNHGWAWPLFPLRLQTALLDQRWVWVAVPWRWTLCDLGPLVSGKTTVLRRERLGTGQSFGSFFIKFILLISASGVGTVGNIPHW